MITPTRLDELLQDAERLQGVSLGEDAWKRLRQNTAAMVALWFLVGIALVAIFTPFLPFQGPVFVQPDRNLQEPSFFDSIPIDPEKLETYFGQQGWINSGLIHARVAIFGTWSIPSICGTDELGRDLLSRIFWGARVSITVGVMATFVSLLIGVPYGAISGYAGGWIDEQMMRFVDVLYSVPFIFIVIFIMTVLSAEGWKESLEAWGIERITVFFILVGAIYWLTMARVVRGQVLSLKNETYVEAARTIGASQARIIAFHLIPNLLSIVIVYLTLTIPSVMLFEAFLSFVGLGVRAPDVSWGLLAQSGFEMITPVRIYWWLILFPGIALGSTLYALNFLGDGLRDALDPKLKNR